MENHVEEEIEDTLESLFFNKDGGWRDSMMDSGLWDGDNIPSIKIHDNFMTQITLYQKGKNNMSEEQKVSPFAHLENRVWRFDPRFELGNHHNVGSQHEFFSMFLIDHHTEYSAPESLSPEKYFDRYDNEDVIELCFQDMGQWPDNQDKRDQICVRIVKKLLRQMLRDYVNPDHFEKYDNYDLPYYLIRLMFSPNKIVPALIEWEKALTEAVTEHGADDDCFDYIPNFYEMGQQFFGAFGLKQEWNDMIARIYAKPEVDHVLFDEEPELRHIIFNIEEGEQENKMEKSDCFYKYDGCTGEATETWQNEFSMSTFECCPNCLEIRASLEEKEREKMAKIKPFSGQNEYGEYYDEESY